MSEPNGRHFWWKLILALMVPVAVSLISYGALRSDVKHLQETTETKASREVVDAQYNAILRAIEGLRQDITEVRRRP